MELTKWERTLPLSSRKGAVKSKRRLLLTDPNSFSCARVRISL